MYFRVWLKKVSQKAERDQLEVQTLCSKHPAHVEPLVRCWATSATAKDYFKKLRVFCVIFNMLRAFSPRCLQLTCIKLLNTKKPEAIILKEFQWWNRSWEKQRVWVSSYRSQSFEQLDGQAWKRRVMLVVDVFGQDRNKIVSVSTWRERN